MKAIHKRTSYSLVAILLVATINGPSALADTPGSPGIVGEQNGNATNLYGTASQPGGSSGGGRANQGRRVTMSVPACPGNDPRSGATWVSICQQAIGLCAATPALDDVMFWFYTGPPGVAVPSAGQWTRTGAGCRGPGGTNQRATPAFTLRDFQRLPLPAGAVHIQPPTLSTLINIPTNVYLDARPVTLTTSILGTTVTVHATPISYRWTFGDGTSLATSDPGAPYPSLRTTHVYTRPGSRTVTLTTAYTGEYSLPGGPWQPIAGQATVTSAPITLTVVAARNQLVDSP